MTSANRRQQLERVRIGTISAFTSLHRYACTGFPGAKASSTGKISYMQVVMAGHPFSTGSPSISSSVNPDLLSSLTSSNSAILPSTFYSMSARNRPVTPPQNASNLTSTPISNKTSGSYTYASEIHDRDSANYCLALETSGLFLGAMLPTHFLDKFLLISQDASKCPNSRGAFASVGSTEKEIDMYSPFVTMGPVSCTLQSPTCISGLLVDSQWTPCSVHGVPLKST